LYCIKKETDVNTPSINPHKSKCKIRNRQACNANLSKRGSLTLFISDELLKYRSSLADKKKAAGEFICPHIILQCCLSVRLNCCLPYPAVRVQGFKESVSAHGRGKFARSGLYDAVSPPKNQMTSGSTATDLRDILVLQLTSSCL
jgi:hypothetical protein